MGANSAYVTAAEYFTATGKTDTAKEVEITSDLIAISRYLEGKMGRFFTKDADDVERIYIPEFDAAGIWVDDMSASPSSIKIDIRNNGTYEKELSANDYELHPLNAPKGPEPHPFTRIELTPWGAVRHFQKGERVLISAKWGWPDVPESIKRATIHLTAILRLETPRATRRIAELGDVMEASPDAMNIVRQLTDQYKVWRV